MVGIEILILLVLLVNFRVSRITVITASLSIGIGSKPIARRRHLIISFVKIIGKILTSLDSKNTANTANKLILNISLDPNRVY